MKYYKKELLSNRLSLPNGKTVRFEQIGDSDTGVLATEDAGLIAELDKAAASGRGGVVEITEQVFGELKKNPPAGRSRRGSLDAQSVRQLLGSRGGQNGAKAVAAVNNQPSQPMEIPKGLVTVSSRKKLMKELAAKESTQAATVPPQPTASLTAQSIKPPIPQRTGA